jgi:Family of unknown function (DUF6188)
VIDQRPDGSFTLGELEGLPVKGILLSGLIKLLFGKDQDTILHIERDFTVWTSSGASGAKVEFRPYLEDWAPSGMQELARLFNSVVSKAEADPDATLRLTFTNGYRLQIDPDPQYEGWTLWSADGSVLSQPAGGGFRAPG